MTRWRGRIIRYLGTIKCYLCFFVIWFGFTFFLFVGHKTDHSGGDLSTRLNRERRINNGYNINADNVRHYNVGRDCECSPNQGLNSTVLPAKSRLPAGGPDGQTETAYTLEVLLAKVKTDAVFLDGLLNQPGYLHRRSKEVLRSFLTDTPYNGFEQELTTHLPRLQKGYNIRADTIVFLHVQKTGGTYFNARMRTLSAQLPFPCKCDVVPCLTSCRPANNTVWIYTWATTGWKCGLHADWTQLHRCLPDLIDRLEGKHRERRYFYTTQLRNPITRYLSEWGHVFRGNHWQDATLGCGRGVADWVDVRPCFIRDTWKGVSLEDFMACRHNLATNRQTRMLADLNLTDCYRDYTHIQMQIKRTYSWVKSAMYNLKSMEYFGLMEEPLLSESLFKETFGLELKLPNYVPALPRSFPVTKRQFMAILKQVELDIHVYMFAKALFNKRASLQYNRKDDNMN